MTNSPLLVIVGPTAVGKTELALHLARDFEVEIVSADSRQIYRGLDIGTAKPTRAEQARVPHHLIDVVEPDQIFTLADFQERANLAIESICQHHRLPLLVGGTGQWVWAVVEGWNIPRVPPDQVLRAELEAQAGTQGPEALHTRLRAVDPVSAQKIDPRNVRRVIRALEVYEKTGIPISQHQRKSRPPYRPLVIGLTMPRPVLYERIDRRVERMLDMGLLAEVEALVQAGTDWTSPALMGLGYRQLGPYFRGEQSLDDAVALIKRDTRRFVRQQYNWFQLNDERIHWFDIGSGAAGIHRQIAELVQAELI
jgi:tRNA dimethylallyltransferase